MKCLRYNHAGFLTLSPLSHLQAAEDEDGSTEVQVLNPRKPIKGLGTGGLGKSRGLGKGLPFHLVEASIEDIHNAIKTQKITCTQLVQFYLDRIEAYSGQCTSYLDENENPKPPDLVMPSGKGIGSATSPQLPMPGS